MTFLIVLLLNKAAANRSFRQTIPWLQLRTALVRILATTRTFVRSSCWISRWVFIFGMTRCHLVLQVGRGIWPIMLIWKGVSYDLLWSWWPMRLSVVNSLFLLFFTWLIWLSGTISCWCWTTRLTIHSHFLQFLRTRVFLWKSVQLIQWRTPAVFASMSLTIVLL